MLLKCQFKYLNRKQDFQQFIKYNALLFTNHNKILGDTELNVYKKSVFTIFESNWGRGAIG